MSAAQVHAKIRAAIIEYDTCLCIGVLHDSAVRASGCHSRRLNLLRIWYNARLSFVLGVGMAFRELYMLARLTDLVDLRALDLTSIGARMLLVMRTMCLDTSLEYSRQYDIRTYYRAGMDTMY